MAETPHHGPSQGQGSSGLPGAHGQFSGAPSGSRSWPTSAPRGASRLLTFVSLGISTIATVLAVVGWFRPIHTVAQAAEPSGGRTYTERQISDAKTRACNAFETVDKGVTLQTNGEASDDPAMAKAQGANARLATISGGWYLKARLDPATPEELSSAIRHLSEVLLDLGANYEAGVKDDEAAQAALKSETNSTFNRVAQLCK